MSNELKIQLPSLANPLSLGLFLMIIKVLLSISSLISYPTSVDNVLTVVIVVLLVLSIIIQRYPWKTLLLYFFIGLFSLYSSVLVGNYAILITVIAILASREKNVESLIDFIYKYELSFFVVHTVIALFMTIFIGKSVIYSGSSFHFGFGNRNRFSIYLFNLIMMWIYLNYKRIKLKNIFAILLIGILCYSFTGTRTNLAEIIFVVILLLLKRIPGNFISKFQKIAASLIVPVAALFSVVMSYLYSKGNIIAYALDLVISSRFRLGAYALSRYGLSFFGQKVNYSISWDSQYRLSTFTFDNIYTYLAVNQGIIWIILISILFFLLAKHNDDAVNLCIITWGLYGMTEVHGLNGFMFFPILLLVILLQRKDEFPESKLHL